MPLRKLTRFWPLLLISASLFQTACFDGELDDLSFTSSAQTFFTVPDSLPLFQAFSQPSDSTFHTIDQTVEEHRLDVGVLTSVQLDTMTLNISSSYGSLDLFDSILVFAQGHSNDVRIGFTPDLSENSSRSVGVFRAFNSFHESFQTDTATFKLQCYPNTILEDTVQFNLTLDMMVQGELQ